MLVHQQRTNHSAFNAGILTTFGKLSQQDIESLDGNSERLETLIAERYGSSREVARNKVERFRFELSNGLANHNQNRINKRGGS